MNVGIYATTPPSEGGAYQYTLSIINCLKRLDTKNNYFIFTSKTNGLEKFGGGKWKLVYIRRSPVKRLVLKMRNYKRPPAPQPQIKPVAPQREESRIKRVYAKSKAWIKDYLVRNILYKTYFDKIDLMIFPAPDSLSYNAGIPFISAIHDLQHRLQPEFPEVSADGQWEKREILFGNIARKAMAILVDSEVGKGDVINIYNTPPERLKVLPFFPPGYLTSNNNEGGYVDVREKYNLPEKYIFYPAQFWPHKNHLSLIKALHLIKTKYNYEVSLVIVGSTEVPFSTFGEVTRTARELGVEKQLFYLGYVPCKDMRLLYTAAQALVMPTFFGPTNIPILEAFVLGCPVITSNIRGMREQVGDAGLLADPRNAGEIAEAIHRIYTEPELVKILAKKGLEKAAKWTEKDFAQRLAAIIDECGQNWGEIDE